MERSGVGVITSDGSPLSAWRKSSVCAHSGCVEVQIGQAVVRVRNSRRPEQTVEFTGDEWAAFLIGARAGEFIPASADGAPIAGAFAAATQSDSA